MIKTYTRSDGKVLDLSGLAENELAYFERALAAYRTAVPWFEFCQFTQSAENPALERGRATIRSIEHPLFLAILDMEGRLGVKQGYLRPAPGHAIERDPLADAEVSIIDAAREKGVSRQTLYVAIAEGTLVGTKVRPARISKNTLVHWRPQRVRAKATA